MAKEGFSIFDPESHKGAHKREEKKKPPSREMATEREDAGESPLEKKSSTPSNPASTSEIISQIRLLQSDLQKQIDDVAKLAGQDLEKIKQFLSNKANFTAKEWEAIELHREMISSSLGVKSKEVVKKEKRSQENRKVAQGRKGKTLGARRRWIDMH